MKEIDKHRPFTKCFAYLSLKKEINGQIFTREDCSALSTMLCVEKGECPFYKRKEDVQTND